MDADAQARALLLREVHRRAYGSKDAVRERLLAFTFEQQRAFISDPSRFKSLLCSRRAGKSYAIGVYLILTCLETANATTLYVGLTKDTAKRIMVRPILDEIIRKAGVEAPFSETDYAYYFPNGSVIYILGMDASEAEMEKALGQKYQLVVIDECQSFRQDLESMVRRNLRPAVADVRGVICMTGTPGFNLHSFYYRVTNDAKGWTRHHWNTLDNPFMREVWTEEIAALKAENDNVEELPFFQREYLGRWVLDTSKLVYKWTARNAVASLPPDTARVATGRPYAWHYRLGIDLGYNDDTAFVVVAYRADAPTLYVVEAFKKPEMGIEEIAVKIRELSSRYAFDRIVIDPANKTAVEELRRRYSLPLHPAEKAGKEDAIEQLNADLGMGRVKTLAGGADALVEEWRTLTWLVDERKGTRKENPSAPNHLADACLYVWRDTFAHLWNAPDASDMPKTADEELDEMMREDEQNHGRRDDAFFDEEIAS